MLLSSISNVIIDFFSFLKEDVISTVILLQETMTALSNTLGKPLKNRNNWMQRGCMVIVSRLEMELSKTKNKLFNTGAAVFARARMGCSIRPHG